MKVKIAQIQAHVYEEKGENLKELERNLERIKDEKIDLVTLGEMFNCPYQTPCFPVYAEAERGETWQKLSALAFGRNSSYHQPGIVKQFQQR